MDESKQPSFLLFLYSRASILGNLALFLTEIHCWPDKSRKNGRSQPRLDIFGSHYAKIRSNSNLSGNMMERWILFGIAIFLLTTLGASCASQPASVPQPGFSDSPYRPLDSLKEGTILHVPTGIEVTPDQLLNILSVSRIVYVGETHTNLEDHQVELNVLKGLYVRDPGNVTVGMEMFQKPAQEKLDRWSRGELNEQDFMEVWQSNWDQSYNYYRDILRFIRDNKIPLVALNASDELVRAVMMNGTSRLPDNLKKELPEFDTNDKYHREALKAVFGGHAHGQEGFDRFYETMLIWDETMAQSVASYLGSSKGRGKKMVVFTGGFHVNYGFGVPRRVFRRLKEPYSIVMPYTSVIPENRKGMIMDVKPVSIPLYYADFVWAVGYRDLEDETPHLGVQIEATDKGVAVRKVMPGSTALKLGVQEGDIILSCDGQSILKPFDLIHLISLKPPGSTVSLQVRRGAETIILKGQFESNPHSK